LDKAKAIGKALSLHYFLHQEGYNYFNMNKLTYKEIWQLIDGRDAYHNPIES